MEKSRPPSLQSAILKLSKRGRTCLQRLQVRSLRDLAVLQMENVKRLPNCGQGTAEEIARLAKQFGVPLGSAIWDKESKGAGPEAGGRDKAGSPAEDPRPLPLDSLSVRGRGRLEDLGVRRVGDLARITFDQLTALPNCGCKTAKEIADLAERLGVPIGSELLVSPSEGPVRADPDITISSLRLSKRARATLAGLKVHRVKDLARVTRRQLLNLGNCGLKTYLEIFDIAGRMGVRLGTERGRSGPRRVRTAALVRTPAGEDFDLDLFHRTRDFYFSHRARRLLERLGLTYVGDLVQLTGERLMAERNCGERTLRELETFVENLGFALGMELPGWNKDVAAKIFEKNRARLKSLRQEFVSRSYRLPGKPSRSVEDEVRMVVSRVADSRDADVTCSWLGMDAEKLPTLDRVGRAFSLTRERVRQILVKVRRKAVLAGIPTPRLDAALELIAGGCPSDSSTLAKKLVESGSCRSAVSPASLLRAADLFGRKARCWVVAVDKHPFCVRKEHKKILRKILSIARRSVARSGCAAVGDVAKQVSSATGAAVDLKFTRKVLSARSDFAWLDETSGWFWLADVRRNRVLNYMDKVLSASPEVSLTELRARISRHFHMERSGPPRRVLQAMRGWLDS